MKRWTAVLLVVASSLAFAGTGKISGIVVDESSVPVKHMRVEAFPLDRYGEWSNGTYTATTNQHGQFLIVVSVSQSFGYRWRVYPHEEDRYYPDLSGRFYQTDENHGVIVQLEKPDLQATVEPRLGRKAAALMAKVTDATTGTVLKSFHCELAWAEDPNKWLRMDEAAGEYFTLLLPSNTDVTLTISSPGYNVWTYPGFINVGPGQELPLDIQLHRVRDADPPD